jgi:vancomycin permeability regulator SanA
MPGANHITHTSQDHNRTQALFHAKPDVLQACCGETPLPFFRSMLVATLRDINHGW